MTETATAKTKLYLLTVLTDGDKTQSRLAEALSQLKSPVVKWDDLGERQLAFKINGLTSLRLLSVYFTQEDGANVQQLKTVISQMSEVKRFLLTVWRDDPMKTRPSRDRLGARKETAVSFETKPEVEQKVPGEVEEVKSNV